MKNSNDAWFNFLSVGAMAWATWVSATLLDQKQVIMEIRNSLLMSERVSTGKQAGRESVDHVPMNFSERNRGAVASVGGEEAMREHDNSPRRTN